MNRREFVSGVAAATAFASFAPTEAIADGKRVALVIGNGAYRNVPALLNPPNDASDIAAALKRLGFAVTLITDGSFDEMRRGLIALGHDAAGAGMAAVYFAGHGMEINGENWLIPIDAELKRDTDAANEAIGLQSVMLQVSNTKSLGLVILDACRNNPFAAKMNRSLATRALSSGLGRIEPVGNVLVAYAARDGTTALDGDQRNSPFASALLRNIETPGVEVTFMFRNVRDDVMEATRNEQQPFVYGSLSRKAIYLAGLPPDGAAGTSSAAAPTAAAAPTPPPARTASIGAIDPALVGTWEVMVPTRRGQSRWVWQILTDGAYRFHAEPSYGARPHEGTMTASNGHWTLRAVRGLQGYSDGGSYEMHDTIAVITGKLGTGTWKRASE
jgi:hypothetical protein